jgi:hypothetical protein
MVRCTRLSGQGFLPKKNCGDEKAPAKRAHHKRILRENNPKKIFAETLLWKP